jgi:predicted RecA/RadA family phage recombinase
MADIAVTAANVAASSPDRNGTVINSYIAASAITAGQVVYLDTSGNVAPADGSAAGTAGTTVGIALKTVGAGQAVDVLKRGRVAGFTLTSQAYGALIYLSDTNTGILGDAAGTVSVVVGRVDAISDAARTKVLEVRL